jgi:hypothetical protein
MKRDAGGLRREVGGGAVVGGFAEEKRALGFEGGSLRASKYSPSGRVLSFHLLSPGRS